MPRQFLRILAIAMLLNLAAYGQSLADVARATREKQNPADASAKQPVVITTDDLEKDPQSVETPAAAAGAKPSHSSPAAQRSSDRAANRSSDRSPDQRAAAQWKKQIMAEKDKLATLQARIDQLNATIHPPGTAQFEGPPNRYQTLQLQKVAEIQLQLDEEKKKLTEMQDEARRAGMHTAVYDP